MSVDLNKKVAHLIRDFSAIFQFVCFIDHELEKRIVARLGLVKIEALSSIAATYKNQLKQNIPNVDGQRVAELEKLLAQLRNDVDGGIRDARNVQIGHSLGLDVCDIPEHWLFMCKSTFSILQEDLNKIEKLFDSLDPNYSPLSVPYLPVMRIKREWAAPAALGAPDTIRCGPVYAGPWTSDIVSPLPGNTPFQDATIRVCGLMISLRQIGFMVMPYVLKGGRIDIWERFLWEILLIDFFALEEAVFEGNTRGNTPSLIKEWKSESALHLGCSTLENGHNELSPLRSIWKNNIRNKVCAHMDLNVSGRMLDPINWVIDFRVFGLEIKKLCEMVDTAAKKDVRTKFIVGPIQPLENALALASDQQLLRWNDT